MILPRFRCAGRIATERRNGTAPGRSGGRVLSQLGRHGSALRTTTPNALGFGHRARENDLRGKRLRFETPVAPGAYCVS